MEKENKNSNKLMYSIEDTPPWYVSAFLGFQHILTMMGGMISIPFLLCPKLCIEVDDVARAYIFSTLFFVCGIVTFLQTTFGIRLPIVQGGTFSFLVPTFAILALPENKCPADFDEVNGWTNNFNQSEKEHEWQRRMLEIQGAIVVASIGQVIIGYFGIIGLMLNYITPLTIAPSVAMIGISLFKETSVKAALNWPISMSTVALMILLSQYLKDIPIPCVSYQKSKGGFHRSDSYIIRMFPVLLTIVTMWIICLILTYTDVTDNEFWLHVKIDLESDMIKEAPAIRIPYPFQWGWPTVSIAGVLGMLAGVVASAIESIGDYYACARLSGAPPPPIHAINRGIGTEGIGCVLAGIMGSGNGTTSYSENIGAIGITKVGSRRVIQYGSIIMILLGLFPFIGAVLLTIPEPIVGGVYCVMFGTITAVGLSNVQFVDLNSPRNLFILGFSLFMGLVVPTWVKENENLINTGSDIVDQVFIVMLDTSMFISGSLGFILDNTIPGTLEERGVSAWRAQSELANIDEISNSTEVSLSTYDIPFITKYLKSTRHNWTRYVPCFPTFRTTPPIPVSVSNHEK